MDPRLLVIAYGMTIVASTVVGGYLPRVIRMNHVRMQVVLSFVGGMMLGVAVLHLLPHGLLEIHNAVAAAFEPATHASPKGVDQAAALRDLGAAAAIKVTARSITTAMQAMLIGLLVTFFMMRAFHFHQHGDDSQETVDHHHDHQHEHHHDHAHPAGPRSRTKIGWLGVIFGLGLHTFMDGIALGAAVSHDLSHSQLVAAPAGFGVYLAILLHKPLDALSLSTLMAMENFSWRSIIAANVCFGLMCLVGALGVLFWPELSGGGLMLGCLLAACAGVFLCISLSDLLPEVQFHRHDRLQLSAALLLGIGIALVIEMLHTH